MNWGLLGYGRIAKKFETSLKAGDHKITAIASRSKYLTIPTEYTRYDNYEDLLNNDEIDIVYVSTTHNTHVHHAINALNHGKHVLCEKPLALSPSEVDEMCTAAKANNRFLMEALWSRYLPAYEKALSLIKAGKIGVVHLISANFNFRMNPDQPKERLIKPELAAGAMWDVGIYPLSLIQDIYVSDPVDMQVMAKLSPLGIEDRCVTQLSYDGDRYAQFSCGIDNNSHNHAVISGSLGSIILEDFWKCERFTIHDSSGSHEHIVPMKSNGLIHEANACLTYIGKGQIESDRITLNQSRQLSKIMEDIIGLARKS